ncbi:Beta-glucosidase [Orbilia brochopaga]|nr:Beta-glucosidase [Drechslerella brochopaga]
MYPAYSRDYLDPPHARRRARPVFPQHTDFDDRPLSVAPSATAVGSRESTLYNSSAGSLIPPQAQSQAPSRLPPKPRAVEIPPEETVLIPGLQEPTITLERDSTPEPTTVASGSVPSAPGDGVNSGSSASSESEPSEKPSLYSRFTSRWRNPVIVGAVIMLLLGLIIGLAVGLTRAQSRGNTKVLARSRPYYPTPRGGWVQSWQDSYAQAAKLVDAMDVTEKVNLTTGIGWSMGPCVGNTGSTKKIGSLCLQDGPTGIRFADDITAFPAGITVAATWSKYHMAARGKALGAEARAKGVNVILGPCIGPLGRFPTGGRNWEAFGSDPYLQGVAAGITIEAIQSEGVIATAKHYIGNEQERFRQVPEAHLMGFGNVTEAISANIGDRTLHELYLWPFAEAVHAGVGAIMCSYNQVNNSYACQNSYLLNGVLKDELGFQGFVMSDWLAHHSGVASALAGMDMSMPGDARSFLDGDTYWGTYLTESIVNKTLPIERLDDMALRIVATWIQMGQHKDFPEVSFSSWTKQRDGLIYQGTQMGPVDIVNDFVDVRANHSALSQDIAAEGIVLLKNFNNTALPLNDTKFPRAIMIFGSDAGPSPYGPNGCIDRGCNSGTLGQGWGSGSVEYTYQITPLEAIQGRLLAKRGAKRPIVEYSLNDSDLGRASSLAETPGAKCFVFVTADSGEAYITSEGNMGDRNDLYLWHNGDALITTVASKCNDTVVVIHSVGPVVMESWINNPNVTAVLMAHLPAAESGSSLTNILWGDIPPSGHLPYTIGKSLQDYGPYGDILREPNARMPQDDFEDGLDIDYRYFDANNIEPRFEFGFGLSYTTFEYGNLTIKHVYEGNLTSELPPPPDKLAAPNLKSQVPSPDSVVFPADFNNLRNYHYPYLTRAQALAVSDQLKSDNKTVYPYPPGWNNAPGKTPPGGGGEGGHPALYDVVFHVDIDVKNTGSQPGQTVPQLYVSFPSGISVYTPVKQLRGFEKIGVGPGESVTVGFDVRRKDVSVWDEVGQKGWYIPVAKGAKVGEGFTLWVGQSSRRGGVEGKT